MKKQVIYSGPTHSLFLVVFFDPEGKQNWFAQLVADPAPDGSIPASSYWPGRALTFTGTKEAVLTSLTKWLHFADLDCCTRMDIGRWLPNNIEELLK